jgi:hypothetical protein
MGGRAAALTVRRAIWFRTPSTPFTRRTSASAPGLLIRLLNHTLQDDPTAFDDIGGYAMARNRKIPEERICDCVVKVLHRRVPMAESSRR